MKKLCVVLSCIVFIAFIFLTACKESHIPIQVNYITEPCLIPTKDNRFKTCDNMIIKIDDHFHVIPKGFKTDLASIPRILWPVFSPGDYDVIAPAVLHDWHYCCSKEVSRRDADDIFYFGLVSLGMSHAKAYIYYLSLRAAGGKAYKHGKDIGAHRGQFAQNELQGVYIDANYGLVKIS